MDSTTNTNFDEWKAEVDRIMTKRFLIDAVSSGLDEIQLREHFESRESSSDFVEWLGEKYEPIERATGYLIR